MFLKNLIKLYDSFSWIPTIKGALSLDLITTSNNIIGDVDKYAIVFKCFEKLHSEHYIVSSSLLTVDDSKSGKKYVRTFRFFFTATINNVDRNNNFIVLNSIEDNDLIKYIDTEGILLGKLVIVPEMCSKIPQNEVIILKKLEKLSKQKDEYDDMYDIYARSMSTLEKSRKSMREQWESIEKDINTLSVSSNSENPVFCFQVLLTHDGILLLKDVSDSQSKQAYAKSGTPDDYTENVPIHRIFKVAMNYIKYLFHSNYHHNHDHDTYLPASNLYPCKRAVDFDLTKVFYHQMNAFLNPVLKLKRGDFKDYSIDANGILLYAKAFVNVIKYNKLVSEDVYQRSLDFLNIQQEEVKHLIKPQESVLSSVIAQHNMLFFVTGIFAFVLTVLNIISKFIEIPKISFTKEFTLLDVKHDLILLVVLFLVGFCLFIFSHRNVLNKHFKRKKPKRQWWMRDSNLDKERFSLLYRSYIYFTGHRNYVDIYTCQYFWILIYVICLSGLFYLLKFCLF